MGLQRRVGLMITAANATFEPDFMLAMAKGITLHSHRLWRPPGVESRSNVDAVNGAVEEAARYLSRAKVEVIAYGYATGSFYRGVEHDKRLIARIERVARVPGRDRVMSTQP